MTFWVLPPLSVCTISYFLILCPCLLQDTASLGSQKGGISKHGWLYKGNMNSAISVTMRVRHCKVDPVVTGIRCLMHTVCTTWNYAWKFILFVQWQSSLLLFIPVIQEEVFPPHSARGRLLQFKLLQRRKDLQRAQRNHFLGLLYGCRSGTLLDLPVISGTKAVIVRWPWTTYCLLCQTGNPCRHCANTGCAVVPSKNLNARNKVRITTSCSRFLSLWEYFPTFMKKR